MRPLGGKIMNIKKYFINFPLNLLKQLKIVGNQGPKIWQKLPDSNYSWTQSGLEQVEKLLADSAKNSEQVHQQLVQLSHKASTELVPIFKNQAFLRLLADKMKLSPKAVNTIRNLLNRFDQKNSPFPATKLLVIVLFIAFSSQIPLIIKKTFNPKKSILSIMSILDYILTAIDLAKKFKASNTK